MVKLAREELLLHLRFLAFRDIDDCGQHGTDTAARDGAEADLQSEFRTVLSATAQIPSRAHWPGIWIALVVLAPRAMNLCRLGRDEYVDAFSYQLRTMVTDQPLGAGIHHLD